MVPNVDWRPFFFKKKNWVIEAKNHILSLIIIFLSPIKWL